jgi:hypothetical protein
VTGLFPYSLFGYAAMNTIFLLMAEFNTAHIPLKDICDKYFSLDFKTACKKASYQELPVPVFKGGSQKSQWLVDVNHLAAHLDSLAGKAFESHRKMNAR